jgi:hypothetical protein
MYMSYDAPVLKAENCGNERPDFVWEAGTHRVIVEVDEDQHRTYPPECDRTRMINVTQAMGLPCIWIRYNPDTYHCHQGPLPDHMRLRHLIETTRLALKQIPQSTTDTLRVKKLFFDNNESSVFEFIPCI